MKIYAESKSERSSKGQGGNKYLDVIFTIELGNGQFFSIGSVQVWPEGKNYAVLVDGLGVGYNEAVFTPKGQYLEDERISTDHPPVSEKGEKQKGETGKCEGCGNYILEGESKTVGENRHAACS